MYLTRYHLSAYKNKKKTIGHRFEAPSVWRFPWLSSEVVKAAAGRASRRVASKARPVTIPLLATLLDLVDFILYASGVTLINSFYDDLG